MPDADPNVVRALRRRGLDLARWLDACEAGWRSTNLDSIFRGNGGGAAAAAGKNDRSSRRYRACAREVLARVRLETYVRPLRSADAEFEFLDLGCAPGGFAAELLRRFPRARGYGVTLPPQRGGQNLFRELRDHPRFRVWHADAETEFPRELARRTFDVVVDDAVATRTSAGSDPAPDCADRLSKRTLALALAHLSPGGVLVRRERLDAVVSTMQRLSTLRRTFADWTAIKPASSYALTRTYFLTCSGYGTAVATMRTPETIASDVAALWRPLVDAHGEAIRRVIDGDGKFIAPTKASEKARRTRSTKSEPRDDVEWRARRRRRS